MAQPCHWQHGLCHHSGKSSKRESCMAQGRACGAKGRAKLLALEMDLELSWLG